LLTALLTLPHLHTVDLSDNAFGGRLAEPLRGFYSKAGPLRHLYLNNNGLGPTGGTIIANAIKDLASLKDANPYLLPLETLVCGRNRLENGSMDAWAGAYAAHKSLKTVKMVQNGIRPAGIDKLLRDGLSHCTGLLNLDLQDNTFTITGAHALADVITCWSQLETLCVGDCLLSAQGGILLGQALQLKKNVRLKMLSLQYNEIDIKAVRVFLTTLQDALPNLEMIELNGNKFSEDDTLIEEFRQLFSERGFEGLDSLSDMEGESDVEVKEDEYEVARSIEDAQRVGKNVMVQKKNVSLDDLSEFLEAIEIA
jgi:Ran GTPase-activating protein 1